MQYNTPRRTLTSCLLATRLQLLISFYVIPSPVKYLWSKRAMEEGELARKELAAAEKKAAPPELPAESSPYVTYKDLEDYKMKGYGATGHRQPVDKPGGGGGTDAPTLSGKDLSAAAASSSDR